MPQHELISRDCHPLARVARQIKHYEQARRLSFKTQQIVISAWQRKLQITIDRPVQINGRFQLQVKRGSHRAASVDTQINTISIKIGFGSEITRRRSHSLYVNAGQRLFFVLRTQ